MCCSFTPRLHATCVCTQCAAEYPQWIGKTSEMKAQGLYVFVVHGYPMKEQHRNSEHATPRSSNILVGMIRFCHRLEMVLPIRDRVVPMRAKSTYNPIISVLRCNSRFRDRRRSPRYPTVSPLQWPSVCQWDAASHPTNQNFQCPLPHGKL